MVKIVSLLKYNVQKSQRFGSPYWLSLGPLRRLYSANHQRAIVLGQLRASSSSSSVGGLFQVRQNQGSFEMEENTFGRRSDVAGQSHPKMLEK